MLEATYSNLYSDEAPKCASFLHYLYIPFYKTRTHLIKIRFSCELPRCSYNCFSRGRMHLCSHDQTQRLCVHFSINLQGRHNCLSRRCTHSSHLYQVPFLGLINLPAESIPSPAAASHLPAAPKLVTTTSHQHIKFSIKRSFRHVLHPARQLPALTKNEKKRETTARTCVGPMIVTNK